jgi:glycosyltransferase involved in cell wall biosynthesis
VTAEAGSALPLRLLVHALDRTGPPMLARAFARWVAAERPGAPIEVVAFRGGPLADDLRALGPVHVVLDHHEPWDVRRPSPARVAELRARLAPLGPARANLLVSVSAAQALPLLGPDIGPVVTWAVEVGEDLHWLDDPVGLVERTSRWLAGSEATRSELAARLGAAARVDVVPEFVEAPVAPSPATRAACRAELGATDHELLVVGAGIGTMRKGLDLFAEAAARWAHQGPVPARFTWIGGTDDPLPGLLARDLGRPELAGLRILPPVAELDPYLAAADVFLHPARLDAFPLVCVSAAAAGTPVVVFTDAGGAPELFGAEVVGAPYPEVDRLVAAVAALADPVHRAEVGERHRAAARAHLAPAAAPRLQAALDAVGAAA